MKSLHYFLPFFIIFNLIACKSGKTPPMEKKSITFIGTYTQKEGHVDGKGAGVLIYETGAKAKDWKLLNSFSDIINPSYICLSPKHPIIYAASEQGPNVPEPKSVIKVIKYDPKTYEMKELQTISALGHAPCYISTDQNGNYLMAANYVSGNVVQYRIKADGTIEPGVSSQHKGLGPDPRQEGPHAHFVKQHPQKTRKKVYAVDLGVDKVFEYENSKEGFILTDSIQTDSGAGPRHLVWHPNGKGLYVINELNGTIEYWDWNESSKERKQIISLKPEGNDNFAGSADIKITSDGRFLYASIRGNFNQVVVLSIDTDSYKLKVIQRVPAGGSAPRNISLSPEEDYLAVALQDVDKIMLFDRNKDSGMLEENPEAVEVKTPVCVVFQ